MPLLGLVVGRPAGAATAAAATATTALAAVAVVGAAPAGAAAMPNLVVSSVTEAPTKLADGTRFTLRDTVRNAGAAEAGRSTVRYYLTTDPQRSRQDRKRSGTDPRSSPLDLLLVGARDVPRLRAAATQRAPRAVSLQVPAGTPPGNYRVLACADDRGAVKERREHDNCRVAARTAVVASAPVTGVLRSLSSARRPLDAESAAVLPATFRQEWCSPHRLRKLTAQAAIASATAHLKKTAGADAMAAFKASPAYRSAAGSAAAASGAIVAGQPGAALAALLRAHQLQPRRATFLVSAASVATSIGLPNEALGMLDQAARLDDGARSPMGLSRSALLQAARAQALVRVGRYDDASTAASAAATLAPELAEAHASRAAAELCAGRDMLPAYARSIKRETAEDTPPHPIPPGEPWIDDSTGLPGTFREFNLPSGPMDAPWLSERLRDKIVEDNAAIEARRVREEGLRAELASRPAEEATKDRRDDVLSVVHAIGEAPDLKDTMARFDAAIEAARAESAAMWGTGEEPGRFRPIFEAAGEACMGSEDPGCLTAETRAKCIGVANAAHSAWLPHLKAAVAVAHTYMAEYGRRVSGTAAHLSDGSAYELALSDITAKAQLLRMAVLTEAASWTGTLHGARDGQGVHYCIATPAPLPPLVVDPEAAPAGPGPCHGAIKDMNIVVPLPFATIKGSCESLAVEVSGEGWITGFAEVKYEFREQRLTVFGGSKADVGFGPVRTDFKSGAYVTLDPDGIADLGFRAGPSVTVAGPGLEWNPSDMETFSVIGAFGGKPR